LCAKDKDVLDTWFEDNYFRCEVDNGGPGPMHSCQVTLLRHMVSDLI